MESVEVDYDTKTVSIDCAEGAEVDEAALVKALETAGFGGSVEE